MTAIASATTRCTPNSVKPLQISARDPSVAYPLPQALAQPVTKLDLAGDRVPARPEMKPAKEFPGRLLHGRPEPEALVPLVIAKKGGQDLVLDLVAGRRHPASDKTHDIGIGIQAHQVVRIGHGEPAEHQSLRLQENLHYPVPPLLPISAP